MEKTIKIGDKDVRLNNNVGWTLAYRDQFGRDILPAIMPALWSITEALGALLRETGGKTDGIKIDEVLNATQSDEMTDAFIKLSGLEFVDMINIIWALAKCADDDIPEPRIWVRQFDVFPLDEIVPEVFRLVFAGMVSSKNVQRLQSALAALRPKIAQEA